VKLTTPTRENRVDWNRLVTDHEWALYTQALDMADQAGLRYVLGGGLAFSELAGRARNTKDLDLYVLPSDKDAMVEAVLSAGYHDYYETLPYDRSWIFRTAKDDVIIDVIWTSPNHRMEVDEDWISKGPAVQVRDRVLRLIPPEELIWAKLYIVQKDRCDWPDLLNILNDRAHEFDWNRLLRMVGERDAALLGGLLSTFRWLCPCDAMGVPAHVWRAIGMQTPDEWPHPGVGEERAPILDSRDWFGPKAA